MVLSDQRTPYSIMYVWAAFEAKSPPTRPDLITLINNYTLYSVRIFLQHNSYRVIFGGVKKLKKLFLLAHFVTICPSFSFLTGRKVAFFPLNHEILQPLQLLTSGPSKVQGFSISTSHRRA
jgi:hypothetical protein